MPHTARHKATHGRKGHSLKTVIKCDRQRALLPRFADTFLGAWPSPVQLQLSSQFSLSLSLRLSSQSNPVELSSVSFCSSIHISHKSRASPPRLCTCSTLHSLLALALRVSRPLLLLHLLVVSVCTGTCVRAASSSSSSSSTWPAAASPSRSLGRPVRISHIGFHVCHFCDVVVVVVPAPATFYADYTSNPQRVPCLASPRLPCLELPPVLPAKCEVETLHRRRHRHRLIQLPFALLAFNLEMGEL